MARVQLPSAQRVTGKYQEGFRITSVTLADSETVHPVYDAPTGGSAVTYPLTSGPEGEFNAYADPATVDIHYDEEDDTIDNPQRVELVSGYDAAEAISIIEAGLSGLPFVNVMDFGATGDGTTDDWEAIQTAIESFSSANPWPGGRVWLPPGTYRISQSIVINRRGTHFLGSGRSRNMAGSTMIRADDGVRGIIVKHPTGIGGSLGQSTNDPADLSRGDHSILEGFELMPDGNSLGTAGTIHGICVRVRCTIKHVSIGNGSLSGFNGDGLNVDATTPTANASASVFMDVRCEGNLRYGYAAFGGDSSNCTLIGVDCSLNGNWGFNESSTYGSTFLSCHTRDNGELGTGGGYTSDNASVYVGCYTEGGSPSDNVIDAPGIVVRPIGVDENDGDAVQIESSGSDLYNSGGGFRCLTAMDLDGGVIEIGSGQAGEKILMDSDGDPLKTWKAFYTSGADEIQWRYGTAGTLGAEGAFAWPGVDSDRGTAGYIRVNQGLLIGAAGSAIVHKNGTAAPSTGTWKRGDKVFSTTPSSSGNVGWVCTAAGTPGTWRRFGPIEDADGTWPWEP
jgi:hypothetical protein